MSQFQNQYPDQSPPAKRGMSTGAKIGIGCLVIVLLVIIGCVGTIWWAYGKYATYIENYHTVFDQAITVTNPILEPTFYMVQSVAIEADSNSDIVIQAQTSRLKGIVHGNVELLAVQSFVVDEGAIIDGDLLITWGAQVVTVRKGAVITGDITGKSIQSLQIEDGAIVGGQISATVQTTTQDPGAMVGQGVSDEIKTRIEASSKALPASPEDKGGGDAGDGGTGEGG